MFCRIIYLTPVEFPLGWAKQEAQRKSLTKGNICYQVYRPDIWWSVFTTFYLCKIVKRSFLIIEKALLSFNLHTHGKPFLSCLTDLNWVTFLQWVNPDITCFIVDDENCLLCHLLFANGKNKQRIPCQNCDRETFPSVYGQWSSRWHSA